MRITWYGHAAFAVEGELDAASGALRKVILDPYNYPLCGGYLPIDDTADVVSVSHDNPKYHSDVSTIRGKPHILKALDLCGQTQVIRDIEFAACEVFENAVAEGPNAMVKFCLEGLTVAHQGDLGHALTGESLDFLRDVDVLLALAGGPPTLTIPDLLAVIRETTPAIVIPMHYKTPKVNLDLFPVSEFLTACDELAIERPGTSCWDVHRDSLPSSTTVMVLEHAR